MGVIGMTRNPVDYHPSAILILPQAGLRLPRQSPSTKLGTVSLSNRSLVSPRPCSGPEPVERLAHSERPISMVHWSAITVNTEKI